MRECALEYHSALMSGAKALLDQGKTLPPEVFVFIFHYSQFLKHSLSSTFPLVEGMVGDPNFRETELAFALMGGEELTYDMLSEEGRRLSIKYRLQLPFLDSPY